MFEKIAKLSVLLLLNKLQANSQITPEYMPDILDQQLPDDLTQNVTTAVSSPYITQQVSCALSPTAKANINRVEIISIDSVPDHFKYLNSIRYQIKIANSSGVENKYCNPHCDETMGGALGINNQGIPSLKNIKVNYDPGLLCTGAGYEPFLIAAIQEAIDIAKANSAQGKTTITIYSIGGSYNTQEKIDRMRELTEIPNSFVVTVIGNNLEQYDNCASKFLTGIPKLFIIGGTQDGNQLSRYSMVGSCVTYYAPARYISPVTKKLNEGVSFAGPIVGYLIANFKLNNPEASREQIDTYLLSLTDEITRTTVLGQTVKMHIFRKDSVCKTGTLAPTTCAAPVVKIPDFIGNKDFRWFKNNNFCNDFCISFTIYKTHVNSQATISFKNTDGSIVSAVLGPSKLKTLYAFNIKQQLGTSLLQITGPLETQAKNIQFAGQIEQLGFKGNKVKFSSFKDC